MVYVIEFQKRDLPHCHFLFWLHPNNKCRTPEQINAIVSAEIPDQRLDPIGYNTVAEYMMHDPCGVTKVDAPCIKNGRC